MIIYNPVKVKTGIYGFWKDNKGKLYKDNIELIQVDKIFDFDVILKDLFNKGEKSVFVESDKTAFIFSNNIFSLPDILTTKNNIYIEKGKFTLSLFKSLLNTYNGFTIQKFNSGYKITIWTK